MSLAFLSRWRHQMETFPRYCAANSPVTGEFSSQRPVTRNFDVFCNLGPSKRLSKQSTRRWFETPSRSVWPHYNVCASLSLSLLSPSSRHWPRPIRHLITSIVVIMIIIRNNHHTACCWIRIVNEITGTIKSFRRDNDVFYGVMYFLDV